MKPQSPVFLALTIGLVVPSLASAALTHRWSFNGDLTDSVGGQTAQILDPDNNPATGGGATLTGSSVNLAGGVNLESSYVSLGSGLLGTTGTATLELWATQQTVQNWGRIFDIGSDATTTGDAGDTFIMSWTQGTDINADRVEYRLANAAPGGNQGMVGDNTNAPYVLGTEFHIVMTLDNTVPNSTVLTWYSAPSGAATLGPAQGSFTSTIDIDEFGDNTAWLGRSHWAGDNTATADYNEFRTYDTVLTPAELELSHSLGPNTVIPEASLLTMLSIAGCTFILRRRRR
ncbi:hypothetical protein BH23VER1_BH23VER1_19100 [soil metagenome]